MDLVFCPEPSCRAPAQALSRWTAMSTAGPVEHVRVRCLHRHHFVMPAEDPLLARDAAVVDARRIDPVMD